MTPPSVSATLTAHTEQKTVKHNRKMRTKTLLMTAAALAAGVISSQAQGTVYSQNVVGYINQAIPAHHYAEFANQLVNGTDVNQSNNNANAVLSSGLVSDPNGSTNTALLVFNGTTYLTYFYYNQADASGDGIGNAGWYNGGLSPVNITLPQGSSSFLQNTFSAPINVTITGTVLQGTNQLVSVPTGYSLLSLGTPVSTNIDAAGIGLPDSKLTSDPNGVNNDYYEFWTGTTFQTFYFYNQADASGDGIGNAGFYNGGLSPVTSVNYPAVGQGFLFYHHGSAFTYTNTFEVQ